MEKPLMHCIYASCVTSDFNDASLPGLLQKARLNNARSGITGILLYIEGSFFQVLEGEEAPVTRLFETIRADPRHRKVTQIIREPIAQRSFADWTMGFASLGLQEAGEMAGANDFFGAASCVTQLNRGRAKKLLNAFRNGSWRMDQTGVFKAPGRVA